MSRIDEIKERTKNEEYIKRDIDYYDAQDDVQYLLSRLEIAEKVLEWYAKIPHYDRRLSGGTSAVEADAGGRARNTIQQIRE